jgi:hypothetical protein
VPVTTPVIGNPNGYQNSKTEASQEIQFENVSTLQVDISDIKSSLGTIVLSPITFRKGSYKERLDNGQITTVNFDEYAFPHTSTVEVDFHKNIVTTPLRGGKGTFKELIGTSDANVRIRGILIGEGSKRPEQGIRTLKALENVPKELAVICNYLSWLDISYLVIKDLTFPDLKGQPSMQPFEMLCLSDKPIQLIKNGG